MQTTYSAAVICGALIVAGCSTFPATVEEGVVSIEQVVNSVACELASVANDPRFHKRNLHRWKNLTDLDLTLMRTAAADGKVSVTAPYGLATVSVSPSLGVSGTDTSGAHVQFATPIAAAAKALRHSCIGDDPSETGMGLAVWLRSALLAIPKDSVTGVTYTKSFQIVFNAGARFGYSLIPVVNTVTADIGGSAGWDRTTRISVALTPPADTTDPDPIPVYIVAGPNGTPLPGAAPGITPRGDAGSARRRALDDPTLLYLLQRKSPVKIGP